jgi:tight adherence protein C
MPVSLIVLIAFLVTACTVAVYAWQAIRYRRELLSRADARALAPQLPTVIVTPDRGESWAERLAEWLRQHAPTSWSEAGPSAEKLVQAGYDGAAAPTVYAVARLAAAVFPALTALALGPHSRPVQFVLFLSLMVAVGLLAPPAFLDRMVANRQRRIRRALPDALDLLVVCVEAGISLDAAILRVAKELEPVYPELAQELMVVNRRVNAGMARESALHGLWQRTGVEELRALASNMIQSERWGTSIATVLRVYAETVRRRRKQTAERRAAEAPVKMLLPLTVFIVPTLFVVLLGPAMIRIFHMFANVRVKR